MDVEQSHAKAGKIVAGVCVSWDVIIQKSFGFGVENEFTFTETKANIIYITEYGNVDLKRLLWRKGEHSI